MLFIFCGLPASGKSTISLAVARHFGAAHVRVDSVEQALRDAGTAAVGVEGYAVGYAIARDNLQLGLDVVAESVNPIGLTRDAWYQVGVDAGVAVVEIEVFRSNRDQHRARVENREVNIPGLILPDWEAIQVREYEPWQREHILLDTADETPAQSTQRLLEQLVHLSGR